MKFFTNIAHEIRTPLSLIKGPLERVIKKAGHLPEIKNSLEIMEHSTHQLIDLANQLLDYRQTETGSFRLSFKEENIKQIVQETFDSFMPLAEEKKLLYKLHLPSTTLIAYADGEALIKILNNLLSNAIKYGETMVFVDLHIHRNDGRFFIEVKNDGYLIPADMKEKIFEPFVRLKKTERQTGTGIGLALARSLTALHQGELYVKDNLENRNIFVLKLPIHLERQMSKENFEQEDTMEIHS
jgi:signal transduction histidine kinase